MQNEAKGKPPMSTNTIQNYEKSTRQTLGWLLGAAVGICLALSLMAFAVAISSYFSLTIVLFNKEWWIFIVIALICAFGPSLFFSHRWGKQNW